jgi:hypothetical protein
MKIGFLGFDQWQGKFDIGSSTIRCDWVIRHWMEAERYKMGQKYDVVIYQKAYWVDHMKAFKGIKILDLCDPDWLDFGSSIVECLQEVDAVTTSSQAIAEYIVKLTDKPVWFIPDRVDMNMHKSQKQHTARAKAVAWFGYAHNLQVLDQCIKPIIDLGLELIVISNNPYHPPSAFASKLDLTNYTWSADTVNDDILKADIVINPKLSGLRFRYKSSNKTIKSWALGLPVALNDEDLKRFIDPDNRKLEVEKNLAEIMEKWQVQKSVEEYKNLIDELWRTKRYSINRRNETLVSPIM